MPSPPTEIPDLTATTTPADLTNPEQSDNANSTTTPTEPAAANDNPPAEDEKATSTAAPEAANDNPAPTDVSAISTPDVTEPANDNTPNRLASALTRSPYYGTRQRHFPNTQRDDRH